MYFRFQRLLHTMNVQALNLPLQSVVRISALTAVGNLGNLKAELKVGLDAGLTLNEIKEVLVHLYAYAGFPRSLNGISTFMDVLEDRKAQGVNDMVGKDASPLTDTTDDYERGRKVLTELTQGPQTKPAPGFGEFAPRIDAFLKVHLFAHVFDSDVLNYQQRELVTISALASIEGVQPQLQAHISMGLNVGISVPQLIEAFDVIEKNVSKAQADAAKAILSKITEKDH
ncbi:carboxymuconolactone decarboxylase family protein [Lipomyces doorenjongii]|uniref:carboxymuconolactone decarboxylase family protein n=1 Tax=Lipomyces doorenjongii TaxID=383834 RepID=UPI0034CF635F